MHLTLHLTRACNLRCTYCYAPPQDGPGMSEAVGRQALELGARLNTAGSCGIVFFGGEPLLRKDLIRALVAVRPRHGAARAGRFHFKVTTNGSLLDEEFLEFAMRERRARGHELRRRARGARPPPPLARRRRPPSTCCCPELRLLLAARPYCQRADGGQPRHGGAT